MEVKVSFATSLFGLFVTSFLAGSFVPLGSEAHLVYLQQESGAFWPAIFAASVGNTLGGMSCYYIAKWGGQPLIKKVLRHDEAKVERWIARISPLSDWAALLCWLPFVGEIIAAALGIVSSREGRIMGLMFIGKFGRYLAVSYSLGFL